jgi:hypothetical protein
MRRSIVATRSSYERASDGFESSLSGALSRSPYRGLSYDAFVWQLQARGFRLSLYSEPGELPVEIVRGLSLNRAGRRRLEAEQRRR